MKKTFQETQTTRCKSHYHLTWNTCQPQWDLSLLSVFNPLYIHGKLLFRNHVHIHTHGFHWYLSDLTNPLNLSLSRIDMRRFTRYSSSFGTVKPQPPSHIDHKSYVKTHCSETQPTSWLLSFSSNPAQKQFSSPSSSPTANEPSHENKQRHIKAT